MNIFESAVTWLSENSVLLGTVAGIVWAVAKGVSSQGAPKIVVGVQKFVDMLALLIESFGKLLKWISDFLANVIKSDGFLGKK